MRRNRRRRHSRNYWKGNRLGHRRAAQKAWRRRRKHAKKYVRIGKRKFSWKGLSRRYGPNKAGKLWRSHKKICGRRRR